MKHRFSYFKGPRGESRTQHKYLPVILKASVAGLLFTVLLLFAMAVLMSVQDIPFMLVNPMASLAVAVGAFASGFMAARRCREKGLLLGAVCGLVIYLTMMLASSIYGSNFGLEALFKMVIALTSGALGGVLGVNARKRR